MPVLNDKSRCRQVNIGVMTGAIVWILLFMLFGGCGSNRVAEAPMPGADDFQVNQVVGIGRIEPELKILNLTSESSGIIQKLVAEPGTYVAQGQIIIELVHDIEQAKVDQASARIQTQVSRITAAQALLASAKIRAENARINYERMKNLFEQNAVPQKDYDDAQSAYAALAEEVNRIEADLLSTQSLLKEYQADLRMARVELAQKCVVAAAAGQVLSLDVTIGSFIAAGVPFGTFAPASPLTAWCEIDELFAGQVQTGQKAYVRSQGMTDTLATGQVSFVGPFLRKKALFSDDVGSLEDRRVRELRIRLESGTHLLIGSRVECVIALARSIQPTAPVHSQNQF